MAVVLREVSQEEFERIYGRRPRSASEIWSGADAWYEKHTAELVEKYPGKYLYLNADTFVYSIGNTVSEAADQHYGPPGPFGSSFWSILLPCV